MTELMTDDELREFGRMTLHGPPPMKTTMAIYTKAIALLEERNDAVDILRRLRTNNSITEEKQARKDADKLLGRPSYFGEEGSKRSREMLK